MRYLKFISIFIGAITLMVTSCKKDKNLLPPEDDPGVYKGSNPYLNTGLTYGSVKDVEGYEYPTIKIGTQTWMAENLRTGKYNDGTTIPNTQGAEGWGGLSSGAWINYDNKTANNTLYGKLYNWYTVNSGKLCPKGWHIPTSDEWTVLENYLGGRKVAGSKMKAKALWQTSTTETTNESGFSGLPGGYRSSVGSFYYIGVQGNWWSSTGNSPANASYLSLYYDSPYLNGGDDGKGFGYSCRCVLD